MTASKKTPLISSTLINWNRKDLLKITIESYLDTISVPYELFIIDNNSSDGSRKIIESFCKKNPFVKAFFLNKNRGGESINVGLEMSSALLLHVTENDIEYLPGWDSKVIEYFKKFSNLGQLSLFGPVPEDEEVWYPKPSVLRYSNSLILYEALENVGTTSVFRRDIWKNNVRFGLIKGNEGFYFPDDVTFSKDIKDLGYMVAWADHYLVRNRGHFGEEFEKRLEYYLHNYGSKAWIGREGWKKRLDAWRYKPKPLRKSFLLPKEKVSPEKSDPGEECPEPQLWSMFDGWSAEMETIELIYTLVRQVKPKFVLETGTWHGIAATAIGLALKANGRGKLTTIEFDPEISRAAHKRIDKYDINNYVTILTQDSLSYQPEEEIDFLLLDSALDIRAKEFLNFLPKLKPESLVLFHDTSTNHKVVRAEITKLFARGLLRGIYLNSPRGLTVCQYTKVSNNIQESVPSLVKDAENFPKFTSNSELTSSAANLKNANPVCIAGMHRSGTSMVARMLNLLGLYLGKEEDMMPVAEENPEGFWENNRFLAINDALLETFGGAWDLIPSFPSDWQLAPNLQSVKNNANMLLRDFLDIEHWGWKDPRNSLTLPFWQQFFPNMKVVICLRNPLEVAYSLQKRNGNSIPFGLNLWYQYNKILLKNISGQNRFVIHYDAVMSNVERELDRLTNWLGWTVSDESVKLARNSVKFHLKHNQQNVPDFSTVSSFPYIQSLYKYLCDEAGYSCNNAVVDEQNVVQITKREQVVDKFKLVHKYVDVNQVEKLIKENDLDNAKIILNNLIKTNPNNIDALNNLAVIKILQNELYQAREILLKVFENDPRNKIATDNLTYLGSLNSPNSLFDLKSFESLKDYQKYRESSDFLFKLREKNEKILKDELTYNIKEFCKVCNKKVKFRVDVGNYKEKEEINWGETLVCEGCGLTSRQRAAIHLFELMNPQKNQIIYLTEQTSLFYKLLKNRFANLIGSEYSEYINGNIPFGNKNEKGIRNEDLTDLTFSDETFNFVLSFDVLEHIPDYNKALQECFRVLKPGGGLLLSIPFIISAKQNLTRARINASGEVIHILEPEYHGDPIKNDDGILCYYHFGWQILDDLKSKGFVNPQVHQMYSRDLGYLSESIVFITAFKL